MTNFSYVLNAGKSAYVPPPPTSHQYTVLFHKFGIVVAVLVNIQSFFLNNLFQIQHFRSLKSAEVEPDGSQALMEANFRPVQPLLDRQIKASFNECEPITEPIG